MRYEKQDFRDGQVLTAEQLNRMEQYFQYCPQCYTEVAIGEILPETNIPSDPESSDPMVMLPMESVPYLEAGAHYFVNYNGVEYSCVGIDPEAMGEGASAMYSGLVGNIGALTGGDDTGEPFIIGMMNSPDMKCVMVFPLDGATSITISINGEIVTYHKLSDRYLSDDIVEVPTIDLVALGLPTVVDDNTTYRVNYEDSAMYGKLMNAIKKGIVRFKIKLTMTTNNIWADGANSATTSIEDYEETLFAHAIDNQTFVINYFGDYIYVEFGGNHVRAKIQNA